MPRDSEQTVRLMLDAQSERGVAVLRIAAALVVAVAATWLLALPYADHPDYRPEWQLHD